MRYKRKEQVKIRIKFYLHCGGIVNNLVLGGGKDSLGIRAEMEKQKKKEMGFNSTIK